MRTEGALPPVCRSWAPSELGAAPVPGAPAPPRARLGCVRVTFLAQNSTLLDSGNLKFRDGKQIDNRLLYSIRNQPKSSLFTKMKGGGPPRPRTENQDKTTINTPVRAPCDLQICSCVQLCANLV